MANGTSGSNNGLLYGIIGALCVVLIGGGVYVFKLSDKPVEPSAQAAKPAPPPPPPPAVAAPRPLPAQPAAPPTGPSATQITQARNLIVDARRFASLGDFPRAELALQNADKAAPGFAEIAQARREIAEMRTNRGQFEQLVERTRRAIERGDLVAAERTLAEAERIDISAPQVIEVRRELRAAERRDGGQQDGQVAVLLATARAAIALGDFVAADQALRQAEQIDPRDPAIIRVRADFYAAERSARPTRN